jgi:excisionase family DNA binding protein
MSNQLLLTRREAAERLALSLRSFERYIQPGIGIVKVGRAIRIPEAELAKWITSETGKAGA